jgi:hypothetical protein
VPHQTASLPLFWVERAVTPVGDWTSYSLKLADFKQPTWQGTMSSAHDCLTLFDKLHFENTDYANDDAEAATLMIDDIYLE